MPWFEKSAVGILLGAFLALPIPGAVPNLFGQEERAAEKSSAAAQEERRDASQIDEARSKTAGIEVQSDGKIRFKFVDAPWSDVIEFFAKEAGFSLQPIEAEPEGTFKYHDDQEYTVMEALDQLNYALALRGFTLVRNKRLLILISTDRSIPDDLIETVTPKELDQRGKHEILKCVFDLEGLEDAQIDNQIEGLISRSHNEAFHVVPAAKQMIVREKGQTLRVIRDILEAARQRVGESRFMFAKHQLKNVDPETVFEAARVLMDLDANNQSPDGQFKVMVQPLSTELIFRGSPNKVKQFTALLEQLDVPSATASGGTVERAYLKQYPVTGDLEMAFKIVNVLMLGRDIKFEIDRTTGKAILLGRADDHKYLQEILNELSEGGVDFAVIELKHLTTTKALTILEQLYQRDKKTDEKSPITGPIFFEDEANNRMIVKGTPQEVAALKRYLEQLDVEMAMNSGPRSKVRIVETNGTMVSPSLIEDLLSTTGRTNRLQIYMPKDIKPRGRFDEVRPAEVEPQIESPSNEPSGSEQPPANSGGDARPYKSVWDRLQFAATLIGLHQVPTFAGSVLAFQEPTKSQAQSDEPQSVPGADIDVKITDYGIVIRSDDLDALDELELLLKNRFGDQSGAARPAVFYLKYREPRDAKSLLEKLIGQGQSSSGASDPLSSLIGAGVNNMLPGMGDLLGGSSSSGGSSSGVFEMEGDVVILADSELRALIVGASERDMEVIASLITEYIDQPGAPHAPKLQGEFYSIPIVHRDPAELKTTLETMLPNLIQTEADQNQANQNQAPEQQILQRIMQQARGGGQQQAEEEQKSPKAVLGVDQQGHALLVSGPPFIYEQILLIVKKLDSPELSESSFVIMPLDGRNADLIARSLRASLGEKIELTNNQQSAAGAAQPAPQTATPANQIGGAQAQQAADMQNRMLQQLQQMNRAGQQGNRFNQGGRGGGRGGQGPGGGRGGQGQGNVPGGVRILQFPGGG